MNAERPRAYYFIGPPAGGKGTHGKLLGGLPGFYHFSMGQAFRSRQPRSDAERREMQEVHELTSKGFLASDDLTFRIFEAYFHGLLVSRQFHPEEQVLILDGLPRRRSQAEWLASRIDVIKVIEFVCDEQVILKRVQRRAIEEGRADDTLEVVRNRLDIYNRELPGLLDYFPPEKRVQVQSDGPAHHVLRRLLDAME